MTQLPSAIGIFCDDLREEKTEQETIVGVFPDNIMFPSVPGGFSKLALYVRITFPSDANPGEIEVRMVMPDGNEFRSNVDPALVEKTRIDSQEQGNPISTIISRLVFGGFMVTKLGRIIVHARIGSREMIIATLNLTSQVTGTTN